MALSTDEENKVREIIEAFTNGKRLSDLPNVSGNNPFNLLCEVLEDGESKKAALATMLPYMEEQCMYGIERDKTVSSRLVTRIGNTALHKSLPVHNRMRGCLLDDDGNVLNISIHVIGRGMSETVHGDKSWSSLGTSIAVLKQAQILSGSNSLSFLFPAIVMFL